MPQQRQLSRATEMRLRSLLVALFALAACDRNSTTATAESGAKIWEEFSGENALRHVQQLVDFGPRPPGSEALEQARVYITERAGSASAGR